MKNVFKKLEKGKLAVEMTCQRDKELMIAIYIAENVPVGNFKADEWEYYPHAMVIGKGRYRGLPSFSGLSRESIEDQCIYGVIEFEEFAGYWIKDKLRKMSTLKKIQMLSQEGE